ncbi:MAG: hypothetical protein V3V00_12170 [Saprospiraceae bacterium]
MSDNRKILTDGAWLNMQSLLDQKMPMKRNRRRLIWIPIFILIAISGLFYANGINKSLSKAQLINDTNKKENLLSKDQIKSISQKNTQIKNNDTLENQKSPPTFIKNTSADVKKIDLDPINKILTNELQEKTNIIAKYKSKTSSKKINFALNVDIPIDPTNGRKIDINSAYYSEKNHSFYKSNTVINSAWSIAKNKKIIRNNRTFSLFSKIKTRSINPLIINNYLLVSQLYKPNLLNLNPVQELDTNNIHWFLGMRGDKISKVGIFLWGSEAGATKSISQKWGLSSRVIFLQSSQQDAISLDNLNEDMSPSGPFNSEFDNMELLTSFEKIKISTLETALTLDYKILKKISMSAGIIGGYNWGEFTSVNQGLAIIRGVEPNSYNFKHWNYGLTSGIKYKLLNRFSLGIEYSIYSKNIIGDPINQSGAFNLPKKSSKQKVGLRLRYLF